MGCFIAPHLFDAGRRHTGLTKDETLASPKVGIEIPVAELYDGVNFEEDAAEAPA